MNNIHEKDWADDSWSGHTGMDDLSDYSIVNKENDDGVKDTSAGMKDYKDCTEEE